MRALRTWLCAHAYLRVFEAQRVFLRCDKCGYETPGWRTDDLPRPRVIFAAPVKRKFRVLKRRSA